ncbi:glycosyltransferase [Gordonia sp. GONU]|uniref:glycosyltransferase family 2 protein n=1 Tax=Gordonia sp. GONU TaxID=2972949 RepID=UPI0021AC727A|nr:glycosyltransferase family 2 protein [Gordonia sp. GONU]MCR8898996.1 glycosyltransferase [Gordonia sp. GONU]
MYEKDAIPEAAHSGELRPDISVITVVFNNLDGLRCTSASIERQAGVNLEHIVVDGASTDGTREWLDSYNPPFTVKKISEPDAGIYDAMDKGIRLAQGRYIQFLNSGDCFSDDGALGKAFEYFGEKNAPWAAGGINYLNSERARTRSIDCPEWSLKRLAYGIDFIPHPATFVRRDILQASGGFDQSVGFSADQELALRLGNAHGEPVRIPHRVVDYLEEGAHGTSSYMDRARRYRKIRIKHGMLVGGSSVTDHIFTVAEAWYWSARMRIRGTAKVAFGKLGLLGLRR